jgi:prevent-host-death family protein
MTFYKAAEAKAQFSKILLEVQGGGEVVVTKGRNMEAVAVVVPFGEWKKRKARKLGSLKGSGPVEFSDDWHMSDEELLGRR